MEVANLSANWPGTSARMRTSSAYLAAYCGKIAHFDCMTIVREALRESGRTLCAGTTHFLDTKVDTERSSQRQRPVKTYHVGHRPTGYGLAFVVERNDLGCHATTFRAGPVLRK